ncbi:MAG: hypothetical protein APR62_13810 [Smithella sp. SDB]|nr:MAG: hypothetical protein APR62_13810 [Smithella sp. SDB]
MQVLVEEEVAGLKRNSQLEKKRHINRGNLNSRCFVHGEDKFKRITSSKFFKQLEVLSNYS